MLKKKNLFLGFMLIMLLAMSTVLMAATYTVTAISDDGTGDPNTLSLAINQSNASTSVDDNIAFNLSSGTTVTISGALPTITDAVTIDGNDDGTNVTVQVNTPGTSNFRIFLIDDTDKTVNISNMTIRGGDVSTLGWNYGGGIYIQGGTLNLDYITVSDSKARYGGGIYIRGGSTNISNSSINNNTAYFEYNESSNITALGGGIYNQSTLTVENSTINNNTAYAINTAGTKSASAYGGGIYAESGLKGTFTITNSTIFGNTASSTYASGTANAHGGGIYLMVANISNCTVSGNEVVAVDSQKGAGIYCTESLTVTNTIIAQNTNNNTKYDYYYGNGTLTNYGYNIVEYSNVGATATGGFNNANDILYNTVYNDGTTSHSAWNKNGSDIPGGNLYLSSTLALNNNPNGTFTLTYTDGSSIGIDDGTGTDPDQRGATVYNGTKDIGAYEWQGSPGTLPVVLSTFTSQFIENTPTLYWTTQSETDNMGWFVYRNIEEDFTTSEKISEFIEGHGTTTEPQSYIFEDTIENPETGDVYYYWLESVDLCGIVNHYDKVAVLTIPDQHDPGSGIIPEPELYGLLQNEPNPFIESTKISFNLHKTAQVELSIYNLKGQLVRSLYSGVASSKTLNWNGKDENGKNLSAGVYLYKLLVNGKISETKKLILMN